MNKLAIALSAAMTLVGAQAFAAEPAAEAPAKTASHHQAKASHHHAKKASHKRAKAGSQAAKPAAH